MGRISKRVNMDWINASEKLPEENVLVQVRGRYTAEGFDYPKAYLRDLRGDGKLEWCSTEWRGTVAIREWREIDGT